MRRRASGRDHVVRLDFPTVRQQEPVNGAGGGPAVNVEIRRNGCLSRERPDATGEAGQQPVRRRDEADRPRSPGTAPC